jgi:hypothetical protein
MAHPLRIFYPGVVYEITTRTVQGRMLLRPSPMLRRRINGILARAQVMYCVKVHGYNVMSNHWQVLASSECGESLSLFMGYVNGNIALECGRAHEWAGPFWSRRCRPIPCLDHDSAVARLRYCIAQGVKEGLVDTPEDWPGASSTEGLLEDMTVRGEWLDRYSLRRHRRAAVKSGTTVDESDHIYPTTLDLAPLPGFALLSIGDLRARHRLLVDEVVRTAAEMRGNTPSLGVEKVMSQDPHSAPLRFVATDAPQCHSSSTKLREGFRRMRAAMITAYREVADAIQDMFSPRAALRKQTESSCVAPEIPSNERNIEYYLERIPPGMFACPRYFQPGRAAALWDIVDCPNTGQLTPMKGS